MNTALTEFDCQIANTQYIECKTLHPKIPSKFNIGDKVLLRLQNFKTFLHGVVTGVSFEHVCVTYCVALKLADNDYHAIVKNISEEDLKMAKQSKSVTKNDITFEKFLEFLINEIKEFSLEKSISLDNTLEDYGLDSLDAVELAISIEEFLKIDMQVNYDVDIDTDVDIKTLANQIFKKYVQDE